MIYMTCCEEESGNTAKTKVFALFHLNYRDYMDKIECNNDIFSFSLDFENKVIHFQQTKIVTFRFYVEIKQATFKFV